MTLIVPKVGLEPMTMRLKTLCSTSMPGQAALLLVIIFTCIVAILVPCDITIPEAFNGNEVIFPARHRQEM